MTTYLGTDNTNWNKYIASINFKSNDIPVMQQGERPNLLNRAVDSVRNFLGIKEHPNDYVQLLAIMHGVPVSEEYKELANIGFTSALPDYEMHALGSHFWSQATLGVVPEQPFVDTKSTLVNTALQAGGIINDLAGFAVAYLGGSEAISAFGKVGKFMNVADKLSALEPIATTIADSRPFARTIATALKQGAEFGTLSALENVIRTNEKTNSIWQTIKDVTPDALSNAIIGAGLPFVGLTKSAIGRMILALGLGNASSYMINHTSSLQGIYDGLKNADTHEVTSSIFNALQNMFFGLVAERPQAGEVDQIKEASKDFDIGQIQQQHQALLEDIIKQNAKISDTKVKDVVSNLQKHNMDIVIDPEEAVVVGTVPEQPKLIENANPKKIAEKEPTIISFPEKDMYMITGMEEAEKVNAVGLRDVENAEEIKDIDKLETIEKHFTAIDLDKVDDIKKLKDIKGKVFIVGKWDEEKAQQLQQLGFEVMKTKKGKINELLAVNYDRTGRFLSNVSSDNINARGIQRDSGVVPSRKPESERDTAQVSTGTTTRGEEFTPTSLVEEISKEREKPYEPSEEEILTAERYFKTQKELGIPYWQAEKNYLQILEKHGFKAETLPPAIEDKISYLYAGVPLPEMFKSMRDFVYDKTMPLNKKVTGFLTYMLVNPYHWQFSKDERVAELGKKINEATYRTEKKVVDIRKPLVDRADEMNDLVKQLKKHTKKEFKPILNEVKKALVEADKHQEDPRNFFTYPVDKTSYELIDRIFNKHEDFYNTARNKLNHFINDMLEEIKPSIGEKRYKYIKRAVYKEISEVKYYMPRLRDVGNVVLRIYDKDGKEIYSEPFTDLSVYALKNRSLIAKLKFEKYLKEHDLTKDDVTYKADLTKKYDINKTDVFDLLSFLDDVISQKDLTDNQRKDIINSVLDKLRAQGWMSHTLKRSENIIEGYNTDPFDVMGKYLAQTTAFVQKQLMKRELNQISVEMEDKFDPLLKNAFSRFRDEMLRNKDWLDKSVNMARKLLFLKYIALSLKNGFVNITFQIPIVTAMHTAVELAKGKAGVMDFARAEKMMFDCSKDYLSKNFSDRENKILQQLTDMGILNDQRTSYMLGRSALLTGAWSKFMDATGIIMRETEKLNRYTSALAYIRMHTELSDEELVRGARDFVYLTNGKYGDTELSVIFQGKGSLARVARIGQTFQVYVHQVLLGMKKLYNEKQYMALLMGMGTLMLLGGMSSLPFYNTVHNVYNAVYGRDMEMDIKQMLGDDFGGLYDWLRGGLFAHLPFGLSVDLTSSAALNLPTGELNYVSGDPVDKMLQLTGGVGYQALKDTFKALKYFKNGDWNKAFYYGLPVRFATYPLKALQEYTRGLTTSGDLILTDGEGHRMTLTEEEAFLQALGFTPERISEFKNLYYTWKNLDEYYQQAKSSLYNRIRYAVQKGDYSLYRKTLMQIQGLNQRILDIDKDYGMLISPVKVQSIKTVLKQRSLQHFLMMNGG